MLVGFASGVGDNGTRIMIVEPNLNYNGNAIHTQFVKEKIGYGVHRLKNSEIEILKKNPSLIVRKPYTFHTFLQEAVVQQNVSQSWGLQVSNINLTGLQTSVCVIDTGIDSSHPDLANKILAEKCFCASSNCCPDGTAVDDNATDDNGHGTHVAGIVAAHGNINGVANGANLVIVKALDRDGTGREDDLINSVEWCVNNSENYNITAISMSLGAPCYYDNGTWTGNCYSTVCSNESAGPAGLQSKFQEAINKNISVVIATGNDGNKTYISWPSCLPDVTRVSSIDKDDSTISYFANRNSLVKLLGVGQNVNSTMPTYEVSLTNSTYMSPHPPYKNNYDELSGTSMATPMVSGAIAIINQYLKLSGRTKTPLEIENVLFETGKGIIEGNNNFSRINVYSALLSLDIDAPNVSLISPPDDTVNITTNQTTNQTFFCNATDWQLSNISLYVWNSTGLYYNFTKSLTGTSNETNFTLEDMAVGEYNWSCLAADGNANSDFSTTNYSLILKKIYITLDSPMNESYTNSNATNFSCTAQTDIYNELTNMTFYLWNLNGTLIDNETQNISGFENTTTSNYTFSLDGNYSWGCSASNNNSDEAEKNSTIIYDSITPSLNITSSPDSATSNSISRTFGFNISDTNIANCSLIINGQVNKTNSSINTSLPQSFSDTFTPGTYVWKINCSDLAGNINSSVENSFTITADSHGTKRNRHSSRSSYPSIVLIKPETFKASAGEVLNGYTKKLKSGDKINFSILGPGEENHSLAMNKVEENIVNLTISSKPINLMLGIGQSAKLNISSEKYYDLFVKLNNITDGSANLTIQEISEPIKKLIEKKEQIKEDKEESPAKPKPNYWPNIQIVIIVVLVFIIGIRVSKKEIKTEETNKNEENEKTETKAIS